MLLCVINVAFNIVSAIGMQIGALLMKAYSIIQTDDNASMYQCYGEEHLNTCQFFLF